MISFLIAMFFVLMAAFAVGWMVRDIGSKVHACNFCEREFRSWSEASHHSGLCNSNPAVRELADVADDLEEIAAGIRMYHEKSN